MKVSDGCKLCYAETLSKRYGHKVWGPTKERRTFGDKHWGQPLKWNEEAKKLKQRQRVFCASMADVFEDHEVANRERPKLWPIIKMTPWLDWQILTKRPERMHENLPLDWNPVTYRNVWLGTSIEDSRVLQRVEELQAVDAAVRFLSVEPLIGPIPNLPLEGIHWVIVGGESGPQSRNVEEKWVLDILKQCRSAQVPFFFKQWGGFPKNAKGRLLQGRTYDEMPSRAGIARRTANRKNSPANSDGAVYLRTSRNGTALNGTATHSHVIQCV